VISVLIADDEQPAIDELAFLLGQDPRIGIIHQAASGAEAIRLLTREPVDAAFLDIHMPGLNGFDLARAMQRFERRPALVFVTADEEGALEAFDLAAVDYLLKPVRTERLHRSVTRIVEAMKAQAAPATDAAASAQPEMIAVTLGGTTRMIRREEVRYVQRRATTRGCTPRRRATSCACRCPTSNGSGRTRSCGSTVRTSSRSRTSRASGSAATIRASPSARRSCP